MSLTVVGGIVLDLIDRPPQLHGPLLGGSAAYAALAAAPITEVRVVSAVGDDLPPAAFDRLKRAGVDVSDVEVLHGPSPTWRGSYGARWRGSHGTKAERRRTSAASESSVSPCPQCKRAGRRRARRGDE